eukprot:CAMPEP_0179150612 /NCGR_PEP_ID=MMETSP0796-20121207/73060_1 /TAXON_ID=73915 /ORGANISM="Pyrodinium bahamense, Strain pbaha01" /LENGTH=32 /DNA_ID= /DNA_START= /DNA_END= /DNA_ORIENTATION=
MASLAPAHACAAVRMRILCVGMRASRHANGAA